MSEKKHIIKRFLQSHLFIVNIIAVAFLCCGIVSNLIAINKSIKDLPNLIYKTGIIESWHRTSGRYNEANLKMVGEKTIYTTERFGGWICFQHSGKVGEKVMFYALKAEDNTASDKSPYFGLSKINNPRLSFWLFFEVLLYNYKSVFVLWVIGFFGIPLFNFDYVKKRSLLLTSWCVFVVSILLFGFAVIS